MIQITEDLLASLSTKEKKEFLPDLADAMNEFLPKYEIDSRLRVCHFLAQGLEETDGLHTLEEYASGQAYEGRRDLGNTQPGDGRRFKGRGIFQITGRANYETIERELGIDAIADPALLATPRYATWSACIYWAKHDLNRFADVDDIRTITKRINGGYNGLADREMYLDRAKRLIK